MADGANFESLNLEISVSASNAAKQVRDLAAAVRDLNKEVRNLGNLGGLGRRFNGVAKQAEETANRVRKAADDIRQAADKGGSSKALSSIFWGAESNGTGGLTDAAKEVQDITEAVRNMYGVMRNSHMGATPKPVFEFPKSNVEEAQAAIQKILSQFGTLTNAANTSSNSVASSYKARFAEIAKAAKTHIDEISNRMKEMYDSLNSRYGQWVQQAHNRDWSPSNAGFGSSNGWQQAFMGSIRGEAFWGTDSEIAQANSMFHGISGSLSEAIQHTSTFSKVTKTLDTVTEVLSPTLQAAGVSAEAFGAAMTAASGPISVVIIAIQAAVKVVTFLVDQFKQFIEAAKKVKKALDQFNERFNPFVHLKQELGSLLAMAKRQVLRRAINAVIKAVTEGLRTGIQNLAEFDAEFGASIDSFKNAMGLFKNSVGVAVAPIVQTFIPVLNNMLAALTRVMNAIARLTAMLTGKTSYTIAKDYQAIGDSAGGAAGKVKELQRTILGFDEINKLNGQNGSGGGGGGGAGDGISSYETVPVEPLNIEDWGKAFRDFVEWLDKTGVPKLREGLGIAADKINTFAQGVYDALTFDGVQEAVSNLGSDLGDAINNFLTGGAANGGLDWEAIGKAVGAAIGTALNFAASFVAQLDFFAMGQSLATFFNNAIAQLNPEDIAELLFTPIRAAIGLIGGFLMDIDPQLLAEKVSGVLNGLIKRLADAIDDLDFELIAKNIADFLTGLLDRVNWDDFFDVADEIIDGIFTVLNTVKDELFNNEQFRAILSEGIELAMSISGEVLKLKLSLLWEVFKEVRGIIFDKIAEGIRGLADSWHKLLQTVFGAMIDAIKGFILERAQGWIDAIAGLMERAADALDFIGQHDAAQNIRDAADALQTMFTTGAQEAQNGGKTIAKAMDGIGTSAEGVSDKVLAFARTVKSGMQDASDKGRPHINDLAATVRSKFQAMNKAANDYTGYINTNVNRNLRNARTNATTQIENMRTGLHAKFQSANKDANTYTDYLNTNVTRNTTNAKTNAVSQMETMRSSLSTKFSQVTSNAQGHMQGLYNTIYNNFYWGKEQAVAKSEEMRSKVAQKFGQTAIDAKNQISKISFTDVGTNLKDGLINGMYGFEGKLDQWANQFKARILKNFQIKSPSRWAEDAVGTYITEGIAVGMEDATSVVDDACSGIKEGITSEFDSMSFFGNVAASANRGTDIATAIGNQVTAGIASMATNNDQHIVCEVYLDRDRIATAVTKGQQAQNRRYSSTAMA